MRPVGPRTDVSNRKKASGRYEVRWREGARRFGRTFDRRADAAAFDLDMRRRQQLGTLITPELDVTFAAFTEEWWRLHVLPDLSLHTQLAYRGLLTRHLIPALGALRLRQITPRVVNRLRVDLLNEGRGEPTVRKTLAVLQSALRLAVEEERIESNPVAKVRKPSQMPKRSFPPISPASIERMRVSMKARDATLISVLAYAGRDGQAWRAEDWRNWRKRIFRPAAEAAGLFGARPYDLRASYVSLLISEGHTVIEVARRAGHSPETCLRHYARVFAEYDPARRVPAEEQIVAARRGRTQDEVGLRRRGEDAFPVRRR